jgi:glycosyltransferase involved in cell wall biosynthesis
VTPDASDRRQRICFVVSAPETANAFLKPHIAVLARTFDVDLVVNCPDASGMPATEAECIHVGIERQIKPVSDLRAVLRLARVFRSRNYAVVHSVTPKAGLLAMAAARLAGVPRRIHWFTGQVWATRTGLSRAILKSADRVTAQQATELLVDSSSQLAFLVDERVVDPRKARVLASGSTCGVDTDRFAPDPAARETTRSELGIAEDDVVITFLGRLNRDKGVLDLAAAVAKLRPKPRTWLVMAGGDEEGLIGQIHEELAPGTIKLRYLGHIASPERILQASDIFCLPSYREGFPMSVIEAASCGVPAVASQVYGLTDAVVPHETGLLFPARSVPRLASCLDTLARDRNLRNTMGAAARARVLKEFRQQRLTEALDDFYRQVLAES